MNTTADLKQNVYLNYNTLWLSFRVLFQMGCLAHNDKAAHGFAKMIV